MYSQQRTAQLQAQETYELELNLPYYLAWKQAVIEPNLRTQLGATLGDTVLIRPMLMTPYPVTCVISGNSPEEDSGQSIIRLNAQTRTRIKADIGSKVIVEKIEAIPAKKIVLQWYVRFIPRKSLEVGMTDLITDQLRITVFQELFDLPLMVNDKFKTIMSFADDPDKVYNLDYWIREVNPRFPVVKMTAKTSIQTI